MKYVNDKNKSNTSRINIKNYLPHIGIENVKEEIIKGLNAAPKYISSKFFYDEKGARLFEEITTLDEYYPTRTEKEIIKSISQDLDIDYSGLNIIDLGSGDHSKIRLLFGQIPQTILPKLKYYPVDISQSTIERSAEKLTDEFPSLNIEGIVADFIHQLHLLPVSGKRLFCFFGSTIGNFDTNQVEHFMKSLGKQMHKGDTFLLGLDMIKDIAVLEKAYNDRLGITAKFNKNILNVVNNLINSDFDPQAFEHLAFYNSEKKRIEMHLKAKKDIVIRINSHEIQIKRDETIHTENSHKFDESAIKAIGKQAELKIKKILSDEKEWFSLIYYKK